MANLNYKRKISLNMVTLGCSKNVVDSEKMLGGLSKARFDVFHNLEKPTDIVIVNTCGFIHDARQESVDTILSFVNARKEQKIKKLYITGCMAQRYKEDLKKEIPEADGVYSFAEVNDLMISLNAGSEITGDTRILSTPSHYAYLKISEGCDRNCSFCAIPGIRGKNVSFPIEALVEEASALAAKGVKELMIIAQDTTYYGIDIYKKRKLAELLDRISDVKGLDWIRLHYAYPTGFPKDVLEVMKSKKNICKYLDMPLQHINSELLKSMNRGHNKDFSLSLLEHIRYNMPEIFIRTAFIIGYPGETPSMFNELMAFARQQNFERMGVFGFSPEEGTAAALLAKRVSDKTIKNRIDVIMRQQEEIAVKVNLNLVGKEIKVIIDRTEGQFYVGRTEYDSPEIDNEVLVRSDNKLKTGDFYNVKITGAEAFDLYGVY